MACPVRRARLTSPHGIFDYVTRSGYCYNRPVAATSDRVQIKPSNCFIGVRWLTSVRMPAIEKVSLVFLTSLSVYAQSAAGPVFDVASVKPSAIDETSGSSTMYSPTLHVMNAPLRSCIASAFGVKVRDVQGPGWLDTARFDITAKALPGNRRCR